MLAAQERFWRDSVLRCLPTREQHKGCIECPVGSTPREYANGHGRDKRAVTCVWFDGRFGPSVERDAKHNQGQFSQLLFTFVAVTAATFPSLYTHCSSARHGRHRIPGRVC